MQDDDTVRESDTVHGQDNAAQDATYDNQSAKPWAEPWPANESPSAPVEFPPVPLVSDDHKPLLEYFHQVLHALGLRPLDA
jgi:hypothetical protein